MTAWRLPQSAPPLWKLVLTTLIIVGESIGFLAAFSDIMYGIDVFNKLSVDSSYAYMCVGFSIFLFTLLYIFDFSYWTSALGVLLRRLFVTACMGSLTMGALLYTRTYPELPMAVLYLLIPLTAFVLRPLLFRDHSIPVLFHTIAFSFFLSATTVMIIWVAWVSDGNGWTSENQARWSDELSCSTRPDVSTVGGLCRAAVMLWISPLALAGSLLVLSAACTMLGTAVARSANDENGAVGAIGRIMLGAIALGAIGMYSSASLMGGTLGMTKAFYAMFLATLLALLMCAPEESRRQGKQRGDSWQTLQPSHVATSSSLPPPSSWLAQALRSDARLALGQHFDQGQQAGEEAGRHAILRRWQRLHPLLGRRAHPAAAAAAIGRQSGCS